MLKPLLHNDELVGVLRPENPRHPFVHRPDDQFTLLGVLTEDKRIADEEGNILGELQKGDIFVPFEPLKAQVNIGEKFAYGG